MVSTKNKNRNRQFSISKKFLANLIFFLKENIQNGIQDACFSINIFDPLVGLVATNGKGINTEYARASAYAEFIERLQNGYLYRWKFGNKEDIRFEYPDQKLLTISECREQTKPLNLSEELLQLLFNSDDKIPCLPFYNYSDKSRVWFVPGIH